MAMGRDGKLSVAGARVAKWGSATVISPTGLTPPGARLGNGGKWSVLVIKAVHHRRKASGLLGARASIVPSCQTGQPPLGGWGVVARQLNHRGRSGNAPRNRESSHRNALLPNRRVDSAVVI